MGAVSRSSADDFWSVWSSNAEAVFFGPFLKLEVPLKLAALLFLAEVCYEFVIGVWEAELWTAGGPVDCIWLAGVMRWMCIVPSTLLTLPLLLYCSSVGALSLADVLKGIRGKGFTQSRWNALLGYWDAVCRHGPCGPISSLHPWDTWIIPDLRGFYRVFDSLEVVDWLP